MKDITDKQFDMLVVLMTAAHKGWQTWLFPRELGGTDGSHHSRTLAGLVRKGWARRRRRGERGSNYEYRLALTD